jgi:hypothetical protein
MKIERQEKSVIGAGSSSSVGWISGWGARRRAMGGGNALSGNGNENNLVLGRWSDDTLDLGFH